MTGYNVIVFDIGSLLSNTLILLFVLATGVYIAHTYAKYRRLYGKPKGKGKNPQKKLDEV